jgi:glutaryl-CoA dehydrogenase
MTTTAAAPRKTTYAPLELFDTDRLLDPDESDIAATVRRFVDTRLRPNVADWFESATLPKELAKEFGGLGLMGMHLDGYGCAGTNAVSYGLACMELEAGDSGFVPEQGSLSMFFAATARQQPGIGSHLRGHLGDANAVHRAGPHRARRVPLR